MRIVINDEEVEKAVISLLKHIPGNKILIDHFLDRCHDIGRRIGRRLRIHPSKWVGKLLRRVAVMLLRPELHSLL